MSKLELIGEHLYINCFCCGQVYTSLEWGAMTLHKCRWNLNAAWTRKLSDFNCLTVTTQR